MGLRISLIHSAKKIKKIPRHDARRTCNLTLHLAPQAQENELGTLRAAYRLITIVAVKDKLKTERKEGNESEVGDLFLG